MFNRCIALAFMVFLCCSAPASASSPDKRLQGVVDVKTLALSLDLKTFSGGEKTPASEAGLLERLQEAGWAPNKSGVFTVRMRNGMLTFRGDKELRQLYILPFTRRILPDKDPRPARTGSYVVVDENIEYVNYSSISVFGYIGRGSHSSGERYGLLPFNEDFIRLLSRDKITSYIITLTDTDADKAKRERAVYELYLKCRFTDKDPDYIRRQVNLKRATQESPNSRRITEYLLCVDVVGAFLYNKETRQVVREWKIEP